MCTSKIITLKMCIAVRVRITNKMIIRTSMLKILQNVEVFAGTIVRGQMDPCTKKIYF